MPARNRCAGFGDLFATAAEYAFQNLDVELPARKHDQVQRGQGAAPHGIDVGEGIRGRDASEPQRIVDRGRYEIDCRDEGDILRNLVDSRVIALLETDDQIGVGRRRQILYGIRQDRRGDFGRSATGPGKSGKGVGAGKSQHVLSSRKNRGPHQGALPARRNSKQWRI